MQIESRPTGAATCPFATRVNLPHSVAPQIPRDQALPAVTAIARWLTSGDAADFPYDAVVASFHRDGKHLVAPELLAALAAVRGVLPDLRGSDASRHLLDRFLDASLDKFDGRYANPTYLGLGLLPLPTVDAFKANVEAAQCQYDRLLVQLIADAMRFEIAAMDGTTDLLPEMPPDPRTTAKRCRIALQITGPAARRLGLSDGVDVADPIAGARRLWANVAADCSPAERRALQLTMLPVSLVHDEHQFIRVLQAFEATFAVAAVQIDAAIQALAAGEPAQAAARIGAAATALHEAAPLFSLVGTMQVEAFATFREFTEGASAIQSRNYKLLESLCRQPDPGRLDAPAYHSVPEVRQRVLAGQLTLDEAFTTAHASGRLSPNDVVDLEQAMRRFAATLLRWRRTHYRIAVRMLGARTGTGYTEGAPYLASVQSIPVFLSVTQSEDAEAAEPRAIEAGGELAPGPTQEVLAPRGRCPFASGSISGAIFAAGA